MTLVSSNQVVSQGAHVQHLDMSRVAAIVLGGGEGTRLSPLTNSRCKPAICFGGKYRLVDVPMSMAIHSGCFKIFVVTQFLSTTLHQHLLRTYRTGSCFPGFIELLSAEQRPSKKIWFQGTADAVRQNMEYLAEVPVDYFLILSGDQLYNLDFQQMLKTARETHADMVIAALPVAEPEAKRMGLLKVNEDRSITEFYEKPQDLEVLNRMKMSELTLRQFDKPVPSEKKYLGSMGIYLFKRDTLFELLKNDMREDFGKHLIPSKVMQGNVAAYLHNGYWEDIGTIESFYNANMSLTGPTPLFDFYSEQRSIISPSYNLPGPRLGKTQVTNSILCDGSKVEADEVTNSIIGLRTVVKSGSIIRNSYVMGNDYYVSPAYGNGEALQIGENCIIERAIIDKHAHIGKGVQLVNKKKLTNFTSETVCIRDGIIVVPRGAQIPDGFVL